MVILFAFGVGAIRGFALTISLGIVLSMLFAVLAFGPWLGFTYAMSGILGGARADEKAAEAAKKTSASK